MFEDVKAKMDPEKVNLNGHKEKSIFFMLQRQNTHTLYFMYDKVFSKKNCSNQYWLELVKKLISRVEEGGFFGQTKLYCPNYLLGLDHFQSCCVVHENCLAIEILCVQGKQPLSEKEIVQINYS